MSVKVGAVGKFASSSWPSFLLRRLISLVIILVVLITVTFMMVRWVPGDPAVAIGGISATSAELEQIRQQLGLNEPVLYQFGQYWLGLAHGNLGLSFFSGEPVIQIIEERAGSSLQLAGTALALVMVVSVPIGILLGIFTRDGRHRRLEVLLIGVISLVASVPEFLAATFLVLVFAVSIRLLPVAGEEGWQSLVLPTLAISLRPIAVLIRLIRVETLNVLVQDYMRTAQSKRLPRPILIMRHLLPNVITAALTIGGLVFAGLVGSAVIVENVFVRNGLGTVLVNAVLAHDYPVIQGMLLVLGATVVMVNTIVDILLALVDPRSMARNV